MILPFSLRNGYGKDLCPRPVTTVELRFVDETMGEETFVEGGTVDVDFEGKLSPKILAMEKLIPDATVDCDRIGSILPLDIFCFSGEISFVDLIALDVRVGVTAKGKRIGN